MEEPNIEQIISGLGVLAENQNRINFKIDSILELLAGQINKNNDMQSVINQQSTQINYLTNQIHDFTNKLADIQIQIQNSSGDADSIVNALNDVALQIDGVKRSLEQWKLYSEL